MTASNQRRREMLQRVNRFGTENPLTPPNAKATALYAELATYLADADTHAAAADIALGVRHGAAQDRKRTAGILLDSLREISKAAKTMDRDQFPGLAAQLRMPRSYAYAPLIDRAQAFLTAIAPVKAAFVELGFPGDFDETLAGFRTDLIAAGRRKFDGAANSVGGHKGLRDAVSRGVRVVRKLDPIISRAFKANPALFAAWKSAMRIKRDPQSETAPATTATATPAPTPTPTA